MKVNIGPFILYPACLNSTNKHFNPDTLRCTIESGCCVVLGGFKNNSKKTRFPQFMYLLGDPIILRCGPLAQRGKCYGNVSRTSAWYTHP